MNTDIIHATFEPIKKYFPRPIANLVKSIATGLLTPFLFSYKTGHFLSSLKMKALSPSGDPLPWYTYPAIDFLNQRSFATNAILEFGGGQSTLWWAAHANHVTTFEDGKEWFIRLKSLVPVNVDLIYIECADGPSCEAEVRSALKSKGKSAFDVIIIDGLYREEMCEVAVTFLRADGVIICDNSEGYGFEERFKNTDFSRVDFYGWAPGGVQRTCTSIFFKGAPPVFSPRHPICPMR